VQVTIPPLRNRDADERTRLVDFVAQNPRFNPCLECDGRDAACPHPRSVTHIDAESMKHLVQSWDFRQGNFRELELTIHQGMRSARQRGSRLLQIDDLPRITDSYLGGVEDSPVSGQSEVPAAWAQVRLESRADLERIARKARAPLVDEGGGTLSLLTRGARYWCQVSEDEGQLNP